MDCQSQCPLILTFPQEIQYEIASYLPTPQDLFAYRFTSSTLFHNFDPTECVNVMIRRGFVYDVLQKYLLGAITSKAFPPFVEAVSSVPDAERERLLKGFRYYFKELASVIEEREDWDAVLPFLQLWIKSRSISDSNTPRRPVAISLSIKWIFHKDRSERLEQLINTFHREVQGEKNRDFADFVRELLCGLCKKKEFQISDETKNRIFACVEEREIKFYHLYLAYLTRENLIPHLEAATLQIQFFNQVLIPEILEKDKLPWLAKHIGNHAITQNIRATNLVKQCYFMEKPKSLKFAKTLLDEKERSLVVTLLDNNQKECSELISSFPWEFQLIKNWKPLSLALDLHLWFQAFDLLSFLPTPSKKAQGADAILETYLMSRKILEKKLRSEFRGRLVSFAHSDEAIKTFLATCFSYRCRFAKTLIQKLESCSENPKQYRNLMIGRWLVCGEASMKYYESLIWKKIEGIKEFSEKEAFIVDILDKLLGDVKFRMPCDERSQVRNISREYKTQIVNKLYFMLTPNRRYDIMLISDAHDYLPKKSFFFPTLSINPQELPPEESGC